MRRAPVPVTPTANDFRALARSSPWRFGTVHFTHRSVRGGGARTDGAVDAWLDRGAHRLTVRSALGVGVAEGAPYGVSGDFAETWRRNSEPVLRPDGLVAERPDGWHLQDGDPMWRDYQWTAMLDPAELSYGVQLEDVGASTLRGRLIWSATCRPLMGHGEDWDGGYDPRCGCCPLLDSTASRLPEYGPDHPMLRIDDLPTTYRVLLDLQTAIAVEITAMDGWGGTVLSNEIHAVDQPLQPS